MENLLQHLVNFMAGAILLWLGQRLNPAARLVWAFSHNFAFLRDRAQGTATLTRSVTIANGGRAAAEDVEIVLAFKPQYFQIYPARQFQKIDLSTNFMIRIPNLGPKEEIMLEMMAVGDIQHTEIPIITSVRSKAGAATQVPAMLQRVYPRHIRIISIGLMAIGAGTIIYGLIQAGVWFAERPAVWG